MNIFIEIFLRLSNAIVLTLHSALSIIMEVCLWLAYLIDNFLYGLDETPTVDVINDFFKNIFDKFFDTID